MSETKISHQFNSTIAPKIGVVHLGLGAFHRAHQALVFDELIANGDPRWGVLGVGMRSPVLADALAAQGGQYTVHIASHAGVRWQVGRAIVRTCVAAREPDAVVAAIAAPDTRWVTLTVTEKGYTPEVIALLVKGMAARHAAGLGGLTVASCDNLPNNGRQLQALCVAQGKVSGSAELVQWIDTVCAFPNSMVDRIVPASTPERVAAAKAALGMDDATALGTEGFWEWVIERRFVDDGDAALLAGAGVNVVADVRPFEEAKLRMLNGCHSVMACMGAVAGLAVIADCINHPTIARMMQGIIAEEISPHISRPHWQAYRDALMERWANPDLKHSVHQIAMDSSQKIPQRWPPCVMGQIKAGQPYERFAFAAAAWMRYCTGVNEQGAAYALNDPMATQLQALAGQHQGDANATVQALGTLTAVWGPELPHNVAWLARVTYWLAQINALGVLKAAENLP